MTDRRTTRAAALALTALAACASAPPATDAARPHIVLIVADDLGWGDVGAFGGDLATPHIDRLATEGARLTDFYAAAPVCTPSRYALLTGRYPWRSEGQLNRVVMTFDPRPDQGLTDAEPTLAEALCEAGYETALVGKWHLGHADPRHFPTRHGFEHFYGAAGGCIDYFTHAYATEHDWFRGEEPLVEEGYATDLMTAEAVRVIEERDGERPLFLFVSYTAPHYGKSIQEDVAGEPHTLVTRGFGQPRTDPATGRAVQPVNTLQARLTDVVDARTSEPRDVYAAMVRALDDGVGEVLATLEREGLADDTLVLFTADNGADRTPSNAGSSGPWRGAKHSLYEGGIRVPSAVRWPGACRAGRGPGSGRRPDRPLPDVLRGGGSRVPRRARRHRPAPRLDRRNRARAHSRLAPRRRARGPPRSVQARRCRALRSRTGPGRAGGLGRAASGARGRADAAHRLT